MVPKFGADKDFREINLLCYHLPHKVKYQNGGRANSTLRFRLCSDKE